MYSLSWVNGTLITEDVIEKMKKTGMKTISISIDGMQETHESFRKLPGSFNIIIKNIIDLVDADFLEHIQVTFIANKKNIYELPALWRMLNNLGIDSLRISSIDPIGRATDNKDLFLDEKDFKYIPFEYEIFDNNSDRDDFYGLLNRPQVKEFIQAKND